MAQTKTHAEAMARMAQDAWAMAVERQHAAEARSAEAWTMDTMAKAVSARKAQETAWKVWQAAERRAEATASEA